MINKSQAFDTVISLDDKKNEQFMEIIMTDEMKLEEVRKELLYFKSMASSYNKKACIVFIVGILLFIFLSFSNIFQVEVTTLIKVMSVGFGIALAGLLLFALFFTWLFTLGYLKLKTKMGVMIGLLGVVIFSILPFFTVFVLAIIPVWNKVVTHKLNKIFIAGGLEPVILNDDEI